MANSLLLKLRSWLYIAQSWLPGAAAEKVRLLEQNGMPAEQRKAAEDITLK